MTVLTTAIQTNNDEEALRLIHCSDPYALFMHIDFLFKNNIRLIEGGDKYGLTPLHYAAQRDKYLILELLIKHGVNINALDTFGLTPLHHAIIKGYSRIVVLLLQANADTEIYGSFRNSHPIHNNLPAFIPPYTALQLAVALKRKIIIEHLLAYRASTFAPEGRKDMLYAKTALEIAILGGDIEIIQLLLKHNAHTNTKFLNCINTALKYINPLFLAFYAQRMDIVDILLENDANPTLAVYKENQSLISILSPEQIEYCHATTQRLIAQRKRRAIEREKLDPRYATTAIGKFIQEHDLFEKLQAVEIPRYFICSISHSIMLDPVITFEGETYDRENILKWFATGKNTDPNTNQILGNIALINNKVVNNQILDFLEQFVIVLQSQPTTATSCKPG